MFDVVGVGTNSVDEVFQSPADIGSLIASGKIQVANRQVLCGGQTATVTAACAALGLRSRYVGAFGSDQNGNLARQALVLSGVDLEHATECDAPNRSAVILVDAQGRRVVLWHRNERLKLSARDLPDAVWAGRIIHVDDDDEGLALAVASAAGERGIPVTSDVEHASETVEQLVSTVRYPIFEQHLPVTITGERDPERALRKLRRLNGGPLCMTLGEHGAVALEGDRFYTAPAFTVKVADTTGAGDVFRSGFIYGLLQRWPLAQTLRFSNAAAALSCTRLGAIASVPVLGEIEKLLKLPATSY